MSRTAQTGAEMVYRGAEVHIKKYTHL